jgi:hypothetical protein
MRNTEKTFGRIMTVVAFVLCALMIYKCDAQVVSRMEYVNNDVKITNRYTSQTLNLKTPLKYGEDIYVGATSDSLTPKSMTFAIYVYFPKGINGKGADVVVTYKDGTTDVFKQTRFDDDVSYSEYTPVIGVRNIATKPMKSILIRGIAQYDVDKNYFINFFANL